MDYGLEKRGEFGEKVGVEISKEEEDLEEEEGGDPDEGGAAEAGEEVFADYGFELKEEGGA